MTQIYYVAAVTQRHSYITTDAAVAAYIYCSNYSLTTLACLVSSRFIHDAHYNVRDTLIP